MSNLPGRAAPTIGVGVVSTGGLAAIAIRKFGVKSAREAG